MKISLVLLIVAYLVIALSVFAYRYSLLSFKPALGLFALCLLVCLGIVLVCCIGFIASLLGFDPLKTGRTGIHWNMVPLTLLALVPAFTLYLLVGDGFKAPRIHDISTDLNQLIEFSKAHSLRHPDDNSLELPSRKVLSLQEKYYQLSSLILPMSAEEAFVHSVNVATQLGWKVHYQNKLEGHFEAVEETRLFRFKDDIAVRITALESGVKVDLRSVSRVGVSDLGANATRIKRFLAELNNSLGNSLGNNLGNSLDN